MLIELSFARESYLHYLLHQNLPLFRSQRVTGIEKIIEKKINLKIENKFIEFKLKIYLLNTQIFKRLGFFTSHCHVLNDYIITTRW